MRIFLLWVSKYGYDSAQRIMLERIPVQGLCMWLDVCGLQKEQIKTANHLDYVQRINLVTERQICNNYQCAVVHKPNSCTVKLDNKQLTILIQRRSGNVESKC